LGPRLKNLLYAAWLAAIVTFAVLHGLNLRADFPNHTIWYGDWAKYTDEGWYSNAAIRAHLLGNWYLKGDFNPAVALPVWPFLEWILFFFTGVSLAAARGLAVAGFFLILLFSYLLLRTSVSRWAALLALTLLVTSPFLYCFSRLATLEPFLMVFTLAALNFAVRLPRMRRPLWGAFAVGLLFAVMMLTKTYAVFLLPALVWGIVLPLRSRRRLAVQCVLVAGATFAAGYGLWLALIISRGFLTDFKLLFLINNYHRPPEFYWPLVAFWWSFHAGLWADNVLLPLAGLVVLAAFVCALAVRRAPKGPVRQSLAAFARRLLLDPVFGSSLVASAGTIAFMTYQNHPQPRYFTLTAVFCFLLVAQGAAALLQQASDSTGTLRMLLGAAGATVVAVSLVAVAANGVQTLTYVTHPEYTFVNAASRLTQYIDAHPNGRRLLLSISGDQIMMATHLPAICDDYGTTPLTLKIGEYQPGWYAAWNDIDPYTLEDLHTLYSLEQVAAWPAFDDSDRNLLVLFKLHPLAGGKIRNEINGNLRMKLPDDKFDVDVDTP
jgi:4-amino-4-deoxy-L-arabinose transferase-like glycosyltransferase